MGAGILPVCLLNNSKLLFLFGQEANSGLWSDFGGSKEGNEKPFETAIREGSEELNGFLGEGSAFAKYVLDNNILTIHFDKYNVYIFIIDYDMKLPLYFNNCSKFFMNQLNTDNVKIKKGLFEKKAISWFNKIKLSKEKHKFRSFYRPIVDIILDEYDSLLGKILQLKYKNKYD